jgi:tetratricopeptide (TPR) repeat protein
VRWAAIALAFVCGCGAGNFDVVRVAGGHTHVGRFVTSAAYEASLEASIAEAQGDWPRAVTLWTRARAEDPEGPELAAHLGVALCRAGRRADGERAIAQALTEDPELASGWFARATCRWPTKAPTELAAMREELGKALAFDADMTDAALLLVHVELASGHVDRARVRAEELVAMHAKSSAAWRALAEVAARQGDGHRAVAAAVRTRELDDAAGKATVAQIASAIDRAGSSSDALRLRMTSASPGVAAKGECAAKYDAFVQIAARADAEAISPAAEAVRIACPEIEAFVTLVECQAIWTPKTAEDVEARALAAPSSVARRWGARMRLRRMSVDALLAGDALPRAEDRATLALQLAALATKNGDDALAKAAFELAPDEPTVARLLAQRSATYKKRACELARTELEKKSC